MNRHLYIIVLFVLLQGCATSNLYLANDKSHSYTKVELPKKLVRITNPNHMNFKILKKAGIYEISDNGTASTELTLKDSTVQTTGGSGLIFLTLFLGLYPVPVETTEIFRYSISSNGKTDEKEYELLMYERYSVFEWLFKPFMFSRDRTRIKALRLAFTRKD